MMMNCYRVTYKFSGDSLSLWVEATSPHHAVCEATMLAMGGTGNDRAQLIGKLILSGEQFEAYSVIETN